METKEVKAEIARVASKQKAIRKRLLDSQGVRGWRRSEASPPPPVTRQIFQYLDVRSHVRFGACCIDLFKISENKYSETLNTRINRRLTTQECENSETVAIVTRIQPPSAESIFLHGWILSECAGIGVSNAAVIKQQALKKFQEAAQLGHFEASVRYVVVAQKFCRPDSLDYARLEEEYWELFPRLLSLARNDHLWAQYQVNELIDGKVKHKLLDGVSRFPLCDRFYNHDFRETAYGDDINAAVTRARGIKLTDRTSILIADGRFLQAADICIRALQNGYCHSIHTLAVLFRDNLRMNEAYIETILTGVKIGNVWCMERMADQIMPHDLMGAIDLRRDAAHLRSVASAGWLWRLFAGDPGLDPDCSLARYYRKLKDVLSR